MYFRDGQEHGVLLFEGLPGSVCGAVEEIIELKRASLAGFSRRAVSGRFQGCSRGARFTEEFIDNGANRMLQRT
jgi:hypothetical protein